MASDKRTARRISLWDQSDPDAPTANPRGSVEIKLSGSYARIYVQKGKWGACDALPTMANGYAVLATDDEGTVIYEGEVSATLVKSGEKVLKCKPDEWADS